MRDPGVARIRTLATLLLLFGNASGIVHTQTGAVISGVVFQDFNGNGVRDLTVTTPTVSGFGTAPAAVDRGLPGVRVRAFAENGVLAGMATTGADGGYALTASGTGPYRVDFDPGTFPPGLHPGPHGPNNATSVQFVGGAASNVDLGLVRADDHGPDNPELVTSIYVFGDQVSGRNRDQPVLISFPHNAGAADGTSGEAPYQQPTTHALAVPAHQVGTTWGLAYRRQTGTIYAAAFTKKFAGHGPNGNGAIYQTASTGTIAILFADLNSIFGDATAGADFRATDSWTAQGGFFTDAFNVGWNAVGKTSLGGMDISSDGSTLYVMNLADGALYILPASGPVNAATVRRVQVPNPIAPGDSTDPALDFRPFAVTFRDGKVYVGAINSAESSQDRSNLRAFVLVMDAATETFTPAPVFEFSLVYPRGMGNALDIPQVAADWQPWSPTFRNLAQAGLFDVDTIYPQPWLTGLAFDASGNLVLGIRDRTGDQVGVQTPDDPAQPTVLRRGIAVGDVLRAAFDPTTGTFALESNGVAGGVVSGGTGNGKGPGGGEFYYEDFTPSDVPGYPFIHDELSTGGVLQLPGFPEAATTTINPNRQSGFFSRGGVRWFANADGGMTRGYEAYDSGPVSTAAITFSKANGVGDLIALRGPPAIEIGNRVWLDADADGIQDAGEPPLAGVTVRLFNGQETLLATAVTGAEGEYYSSGGTGTSSASAIYGVTALTADTPGFTVRLDNTADYANGGPLAGLAAAPAQRGDDRAIDANGIAVTATHVRATFDTVVPGANDHTIDFGFATSASLGDFVWFDENSNGLQDPGEAGVAGVTVRLHNVAGEIIATASTDANGAYLFSHLTPGHYYVAFVAPDGLAFTVQDAGGDDTLDSDADPATGLTILTHLGPGQHDPTWDAGLVPLMALGNLVWIDVNNSGRVDAGEPGIAGVPVSLFRDADGDAIGDGAALATTVTSAAGHYLFSRLAPGSYIVALVPPDGFASSTGVNAGDVGPYEPAPDPDDDIDNDDNGTGNGGVVITKPVTLSSRAEPVQDGDGDPNTNLTVDFGLFRPASIGDRVWFDTDGDGVQDAVEPGVANVTVTLHECSGEVVATRVTNANGLYHFSHLTAGSYFVAFELPNGHAFTIQNAGADDRADSDADPRTGQTICTTLDPGEDDLSWDAGLVRAAILSLGNQVWRDANNSGHIDAGEDGIGGVRVELLADADRNGVPDGAPIAAMATDAAGKYLFSALAEGTYIVRIPASEFAPGGSLEGYVSSDGNGAIAPDPMNHVDHDDNGTPAADGSVITGSVTLRLGQEPTHEDGDPNSNLTVDFGFYRPATPLIGVTKTATSISREAERYRIGYALRVCNLGSVPLQNVQLTDSLATAFPLPATFVVPGSIASTGPLPLTQNPSFDGMAVTTLLSGADSLAVNGCGGVSFAVEVVLEGVCSSFVNQALGTATGTSDLSNDGSDPDTNGNGRLNEPTDNIPTVIKICPSAPQPVQHVDVHVLRPPGAIVNSAAVLSEDDLNPENNVGVEFVAEAGAPPPGTANLEVRATGTAFAEPGAPIEALITIENRGPDAAEEVGLTTVIPDAVTFDFVTTTVGTCPRPRDGFLACAIGTIAPGQRVDVGLHAIARVPQTINWLFEARSPATLDPDPSNNMAAVVTGVEDTPVPGPRIPPALDTDGDGLPDVWERSFGLNHQISNAAEDTDHDGIANADEYGRGTHPTGFFKRFFAEGASNEFFSTQVGIVTLGGRDAIVLIEGMREGGTLSALRVGLPVDRRRTVDGAAVIGQASFATIVESNQPFAVDRVMRWGTGHYGMSAESGVHESSPIWYFAEGATHGDFQLFYLIANPDTTLTAEVQLAYLLPAGMPVVRTFSLPPGSRRTVWVNEDPGVVATDVGAVIESINGVPIVAERAFYRHASGVPFGAGHASAGARALSPEWFFAEGVTGAFFQTYLLLANPGVSPASVVIRYQRPDGSAVFTSHTIGARSRRTIDVAFDHPLLADTPVAMTVISDAAIMAERSTWWPGPSFGSLWYEASGTVGATEPGVLWAIGHGYAGGAAQDALFVLVANQEERAGAVTVTVVFDEGTRLARTIALGATSRLTIDVGEHFPEAIGRQFSLLIASTGTAPVPIVVESARYNSTDGVLWNAGASMLASRIR